MWSNAGQRSDEGGWYKNAIVASGTTTLNQADKDASLTLSGGNLIATNNTGGAFSGVRSIASHSTGKFYCELTATAQNFASFSQFGILTGGQSLASSFAGSNAAAYMAGNGSAACNGVSIGSGDGYAVTGQTAGMAVDLTAKKFWFWNSSTNRWNGDVIGNQNPVGAVGGFDISALAAGPYFIGISIWQLNDIDTMNFGATTYAIASGVGVPTGFGNW